MIDSPKNDHIVLSPLAESALGRASDEQAVEFMAGLRAAKNNRQAVEKAAEGQSGLFKETCNSMIGADGEPFRLDNSRLA